MCLHLACTRVLVWLTLHTTQTEVAMCIELKSCHNMFDTMEIDYVSACCELMYGSRRLQCLTTWFISNISTVLHLHYRVFSRSKINTLSRQTGFIVCNTIILCFNVYFYFYSHIYFYAHISSFIIVILHIKSICVRNRLLQKKLSQYSVLKHMHMLNVIWDVSSATNLDSKMLKAHT